MLKRLALLTAALASCYASFVFGDAILVYETTAADGSKTQQTISITGTWLRIDNTAEGQPSYVLMDTGRMMMFHVDEPKQTYSVVRAGRLYWPSAPATPRFKPAKKMQTLGGVRCREVLEMADSMAVAEHCMTGTGPLKLTTREMTTLSRLFTSARRLGLGWAGVATPDERQVSIRSRRLEDNLVQELKTVSHKLIPDNKLKIPETYKRLGPDRPGKPEQQKQADSPKVPAPGEPTKTPEQAEQPASSGHPVQSEQPAPSERANQPEQAEPEIPKAP